ASHLATAATYLPMQRIFLGSHLPIASPVAAGTPVTYDSMSDSSAAWSPNVRHGVASPIGYLASSLLKMPAVRSAPPVTLSIAFCGHSVPWILLLRHFVRVATDLATAVSLPAKQLLTETLVTSASEVLLNSAMASNNTAIRRAIHRFGVRASGALMPSD